MILPDGLPNCWMTDVLFARRRIAPFSSRGIRPMALSPPPRQLLLQPKPRGKPTTQVHRQQFCAASEYQSSHQSP